MSCENWVILKEDQDYEINCDTLQIRRKSNKKIIKDTFYKSNGYIYCELNGKTYLKHRIVCNNFIDNPNNYDCVDHIDHNRTNNSISNLRWVSRKWNNNNLSNQNFVDEISNDCIVVDKYNNHEFEFLYFDPETDTFYVFNGINYVVKPRFQNKFGYWFVCVCDKNGRNRSISYRKFKRGNGLI